MKVGSFIVQLVSHLFVLQEEPQTIARCAHSTVTLEVLLETQSICVGFCEGFEILKCVIARAGVANIQDAYWAIRRKKEMVDECILSDSVFVFHSYFNQT